MKAYIVTTGVAFGLLALAHLARIFAEGAHLMTEPFFLISTVGAVGMCVWAIVILKQPTRL